MSLLLDALKKAEEAKRQSAMNVEKRPAVDAMPSAEFSLEPLPGAQALHAAPLSPAPGSPLPDISDHLDTVDADLAAVNTAPLRRSKQPEARPASHVTKSLQTEQEAARNVFAVKRTPAPNHTVPWILFGLVGLAAIGIGGWLWWQLQSVGISSIAPSATQPIATLPTAPPAPQSVQVSPLPQPATAPPLVPTPERPLQAAPVPIVASARTEGRAIPFAAEPKSPVPVRITRGEFTVSPILARAYEQLEAGALSDAAQSYEKVLREDAKNIDALIGMATIAAQQGETRTAENLYLRALEADPKEINAHAGLINMHGQIEPQAAESRLKTLLAAHPGSAVLNFALGNIYVGQRRWSEAQLAYFNAHTADPGNPDYLFNLAACLDQMHLPKIALDYYKAALVANNSRRGAFNAEQVMARIAELQP